ncbi:hypothetical protein glysoja_039350 [Glycine soja]|uniref:Uncharacterized protein n=1 Tax=Glycine soja TaxID=3848 RepID=A0A0B2NQX0_GLYSO|nr:hypothetical protein glysoja_039350 [Glycine soja]
MRSRKGGKGLMTIKIDLEKVCGRLSALISIDPARARDDPVIVKNVPYYKAKKALETEVMKIDPPPRPPNCGELDLPLNASSWSEEDLKDPDKFYEMTVLLNAQREISDKILDAQWETKWRQDKLNEMLEAKVKPYIQDIDNVVLPEPILLKPQNQEKVFLSLCFLISFCFGVATRSSMILVCCLLPIFI